jgi:1-acyl-sn-glycerol-3-phosphate acyltransferase
MRLRPHLPTTLKHKLESWDHWVARARAHVRQEDLDHLGPMGVLETVRSFSRGRQALEGVGQDLGARDPAFISVVLDAFRALGRHYFRAQVQGLENVPASGPAMLVGNHSGGIMPFDTFITLAAIWDRLGPDRPVHLLAHDLLWHDPVGRRLCAKFGMLRATPASARLALDAGRLVLVYPGSDLDSWRPFTERNRVRLGGRQGFLRAAVSAQVPVVPVVSVGTHEQLVVLSTGEWLASLLGFKRVVRSAAFPIVWALPWGVTSGFLPYLPLPAQTTVRVGSPLGWPHLGPADLDRPGVLDACYREVETTMQAMLDDLSRHRVPVLGRVR